MALHPLNVAGVRDLVDQQDDMDVTIWGPGYKKNPFRGDVQPPSEISTYSKATML